MASRMARSRKSSPVSARASSRDRLARGRERCLANSMTPGCDARRVHWVGERLRGGRTNGPGDRRPGSKQSRWTRQARGLPSPSRRSLMELWSREFPSDTTLRMRISLARGLNLASATMSGGTRELKEPAPRVDGSRPARAATFFAREAPARGRFLGQLVGTGPQDGPARRGLAPPARPRRARRSYVRLGTAGSRPVQRAPRSPCRLRQASLSRCCSIQTARPGTVSAGGLPAGVLRRSSRAGDPHRVQRILERRDAVDMGRALGRDRLH